MLQPLTWLKVSLPFIATEVSVSPAQRPSAGHCGPEHYLLSKLWSCKWTVSFRFATEILLVSLTFFIQATFPAHLAIDSILKLTIASGFETEFPWFPSWLLAIVKTVTYNRTRLVVLSPVSSLAHFCGAWRRQLNNICWRQFFGRWTLAPNNFPSTSQVWCLLYISQCHDTILIVQNLLLFRYVTKSLRTSNLEKGFYPNIFNLIEVRYQPKPHAV
jgi:hypothetical protein